MADDQQSVLKVLIELGLGAEGGTSVYLVTNRVSGKQYVGITTQEVSRRWQQHCYDSRRRSGFLIHAAIRKYGDMTFDVRTVVHRIPGEKASLLEQRLIQELRTLAPHGYNLTLGGEHGKIHPDSVKRGAATRRGSPHPHMGSARSEETKAKISAAKKGKKLNITTARRQQIIDTICANNHGRRLSHESRVKISTSLKKYNAEVKRNG